MNKGQRYATIATAVLVGLGVFQLLLIFGLPLGKAAWGGLYTVLPLGLRFGSASSIIIYFIAIYAIRTRAGLRQTSPNSKFARIGTWFFGIFFLLGVLLNVA
ncbi:MAG TPA: hypothetical protein VEA37_12925, partial [Flavobacterium sp.]|nr:hypothetical protein [Flavobacterium sp.]